MYVLFDANNFSDMSLSFNFAIFQYTRVKKLIYSNPLIFFPSGNCLIDENDQHFPINAMTFFVDIVPTWLVCKLIIIKYVIVC